MQQKNKRVGAILGNKNGVVEFLGYGTYLGDIIPKTKNIKFMGISLKKEGLANPCIELDSGKKVYGCECWWASEERIKEILSNAKKVICVDIEEVRKQT